MRSFHKTDLDGVIRIEVGNAFEDFRGNYVETFNKTQYENASISVDWLQDDYAYSRKRVLRGLHGDKVTDKLVYCSYGNLYVVVIQGNPKSPNYYQWQSFTLSCVNKTQLFVPAQYAVGYLVMSDGAIFNYKQNSYYGDDDQFTIKWNDPKANIWWPISDPLTSLRDTGV